ncbi:MAG: hypothetical protein ABGY96_16425 [bacterium]|nr:hypothetical protein [Gammaproteobacteria bacterium]HIL99222.1 hypothetical protein [Pseudomonadales bacterium]
MILQTWLATGVFLMLVLSAVVLFAVRGLSGRAGLVGASASGLSLALTIWLLLDRTGCGNGYRSSTSSCPGV